MKSKTLVIACAIGGASIAASAQEAPKFQNLRFTEDWSNFDASTSDHWSAPIKKIEVSDSIWVSVGGEQRVRYESWESSGFTSGADDDYTLFRTQLHADIHVGDQWRVFLEGRMNTLNNRTLGGEKRANLDIDEGSFGNAFIETTYELFNTDMKLRLGRQELQFGKQRLASPLDWANNRRLFDGGLLNVKSDAYTVDFFVTSPVTVDANELTFNNTNDDVLFSGMYYTRTLNDTTKIDAYLFARSERHGLGSEEDRYTLGGRYYGKYNDAISFDTELAYQFGEEDATDEDIKAWMLTAEATYAFADTAWNPTLTVGVDFASGDGDSTDGDHETFEQLFPLAHAYLGFSDVVGRQNVIDYRATVAAWPIKGTLRLRGDLHLLELESDDDVLYNVGGGTPYGTTNSTNEDDLGTAIDLTALYIVNSHMNALVGYSHFEAGDYIEDNGGDDDIDFLYVQWGYTF